MVGAYQNDEREREAGVPESGGAPPGARFK